MDGLRIVLVVLFGVVSCSHNGISVSVLEKIARPGGNITVYCDCKVSTGVYIVWFRNCSHENQPSLVLNVVQIWSNTARIVKPPRFEFVKNSSSDSYDLFIQNVTESDEGLYYCGTEQTKVEDKEYITARHIYRYGNVTTRIIVKPHQPKTKTPAQNPAQNCRQCWTLLLSLCPALAVLSSIISSFLVYHHCHRTAKKPQVVEKKPDNSGQTRRNQDEDDVCYAALEIRQTSQRPRKKKPQSSDFSTYSAINTSRV